MSIAATKLADYQNIINQVNPQGQPQAHLIYSASETAQTSANIGILDASFNPMTLAHESLIDTAFDTHKLDQMLLLLSVSNVDKKLHGATLPQRLAMLVEYAKTRPNRSVAICSHARFIDKIEALKACYSKDSAFYFIVGYDTLVRIFDPKYYQDMQADLTELFAKSHFIAANRGENDQQVINTFLKRKDVEPFAQNIHTISLSSQFADISSTTVRQLINEKKSVTHLVPQEINGIIQELNLYTDLTA